MTHFFDELVRNPESLCVRGVPLKATVAEVIAAEGEPSGQRAPKGGAQGYLRYERELGESEDLRVTYAIGDEGRVVDFTIILTAIPFLYWEKAGGQDDQSWFKAVESASLSPLAPQWTETRDALLSHLATLLGGTPKPTKPVGAFKQKRHEAKVWSWSTPEAHVSLMSYVDDLGARGSMDIKLFLKLTITPA